MITENKELERLRSALRDVIDPIGAMQRECPVGHELNHAAVTIGKSLQYVQAKARAALSASPAPSGQGVSVPEGMKAYGPDHPDYPKRPLDCLMGEGGGVQWFDGSVTRGPVDLVNWEHRTSDHQRCRDVIAYTPKAAPAPSCAPGEVERLRNALMEITALRPLGDVATCKAPRVLVETMERIALRALDGQHIPIHKRVDGSAALSPQGLDAKEGGE